MCVCVCKDLLDRLKEAGTSGDTVPNENLGKMLEDAQRMVNEMKDRNFTPQKTAAEKERDQAKKRMRLSFHFLVKFLSQKLHKTLRNHCGLLKDASIYLSESTF